MSVVEATVLVATAIGFAVLLDRSRHPARYAALANPAWLLRALRLVALATGLGTAAAMLGGSAQVAQVVLVAGVLALLVLAFLCLTALRNPP